MSDNLNRRNFLKKTMGTSTAAAVGLSGGAGKGWAESSARTEPPKGAGPFSAGQGAGGMPMGKIGDLNVSRLISGGNLISGWAHARDLIYVRHLMRHYNTDEKVMDTLEVLEEQGVNAIIADPSERPYRIFPKYWKERGGKIQWIAEGHPKPNDIKTDTLRSLDHGASAIYIQGAIGDKWLKKGNVDQLGDCVEFIKSQGVPGGVGAHNLEVVRLAEKRGYGAQFYVKTLHHHNYWSARPDDMGPAVVENRRDNYWSKTPEETIAFMNKVQKPWVAFKVLAAGAIHPNSGFKYAFEGGADFICVGMFDFQVKEDAVIAKKLLNGNLKRQRQWRA